MNAGNAIGYKLKTTSAITAYTTTSGIFDGIIPETYTSYPVINYFLVSNPNLDSQVRRERYQISCRSKNASQCRDLAFEVVRALYNFQDTVDTMDIQKIYYDNSTPSFEPDDVYHIAIDFFVVYQNT